MADAPREFETVESCVDEVIARVGKRIALGAPLGLGKPNQLINAFYRRAEQDPSVTLTIYTALTLEKPRAENELQAQFLEPFIDRHFGSYVELEYMGALRKGKLPPNVRVHEFYFRAGSMKGVGSAQRDYISTNYTFVARDLLARGVNVLVQLVAEREVDGRRMLSLSGNTDVTLDLVPMLEAERSRGRKIVGVAQVHSALPFMYNRALVEPGYFDYLVRNPAYDTTLFATPNLPVGALDFAIGFHVSTLLKDGGTLQIGIGALGDAIVYACQLRQSANATYRQIAGGLGVDAGLAESVGGLAPFDAGIYGCSEMLVNGFVHLMKSGIVKREVFDEPRLMRLLDAGRISSRVDEKTLQALAAEGVVHTRLTAEDVEFLRHWGVLRGGVRFEDGWVLAGGQRIRAALDDPESYAALCRFALGEKLAHGIVMRGGFFLGPADFYQALRDMTREESERIAMDSVRRVNRISDPELQTLQRRHARFVNTAMMVTLGGAAVSDALEDGQVVSGVGGQYNFVAQAHELPDARSILCVRATRGNGGRVASNIVFNYGHVTIPRHLRDIVVTEYGVADLRAKSDEEIIRALLDIADSRFQGSLLAQAKRAGKIDPAYEIPPQRRQNLPERVEGEIARWQAEGYFPAFPLGTDFTPEEVALATSLREMKRLMEEPRNLLRSLIRSFTQDIDEAQAAPYLERIGLAHPHTPKELILKHLLLLELEEHGYLKAL